MSVSSLDQSISEAWRDLGFYYEFNETDSQWQFVGSKEGLAQFVRLLRDYAADPQNSKIYEHEHFGPYWYLKVMTFTKPDISESAIVGDPSDIARLANLFERKLLETPEDMSFTIREEYCPGCSSAICVKIEKSGFDPATADLLLQIH